METGSAFAHVLHEATISKLAYGSTLARGRAYAAEGRVRGLARSGGRLFATVRGTAAYAVSLWVTDERLGYKCSCPAGSEGAFCKHCVAVAVAWLAQPQP